MLRTPDLAGHALDGRYELHALIGEGAFGRVYRGVDRRLARAVAVKVIKPWWAQDSEWVARFEREAQLLARVSDPGIVQIFDIGHAQEGPYYVAELVEGQSLAEHLKRGRLPCEQARSIAESLCRALASAHAQGVVHCDVKPANVLLGEDGSVKVGDFGVARLAAGTTQGASTTVAGTPRYMSPEQARGRPTTAATDTYSAGVVLYEMLAGEPPFMDGSPVELGLRHLQDSPPPLPDEVPQALREIVSRSLAKRPADRFGDGREMAAALAAARGATAGTGSRAPGADDRRAKAARAKSPRRAPELQDAESSAQATVALGDPKTIDLARSSVRASARADGPAGTRVMPGRGAIAFTAARRRAGAKPQRETAGRVHRSRRVAAPAAVLVAGGALALFVATRGAAHTTVPHLTGLPRGGVQARAQRTHVQPVFATRHSESVAPGIAIAQSPVAGVRIDIGSKVNVVLSSGPPPVSVPGVVGRSSTAAESALASAGLRYRTTLVAAPGTEPGDVTLQSPRANTTAPHGSTVALSVAEQPRWRSLTTFSGVDDGRSVPFRILGARWRVSYWMSYDGTCLLLLVCLGPSARAQSLPSGSSAGSFELGEGEAHTHTFDSGPGLYRVAVSGGHDRARWSMTVQDYY
jgi:serine/threonine-protein kinase